MTTDPGSRLAGRVTARPAEILLVEDSPSDAAMTVHALGTYHRVHVVGDGEAALAFLHRKGRHTASPKPDLIPLDLNLPRVAGREVLARINTDQHLRGIPVAILTTSSTDTDILRAYELGANCYVSKPVGLDDFLRAIHGIENLWLTPVRLPGLLPP